MASTTLTDAPARPSSWSLFARNRLAVFGLALVALIAALALAAPILPLADPNVTEPAARLRPMLTEGHLLGTDQLGRDLLARLVWGTRVSLAVGVSATLIAALIGSAIGLIAAYAGGIADQILMRGIDMLMAFPYLLLALAIVAALGPGLMNALMAIAVVNIPFFARSVRGATLGLVRREFVEAARLSGLSHVRIVLSELLPNVMPVIVITMSTTVGWMILETAGLSFLGLGAQPPQADLGSMLGDGRDLILRAAHVAVVPGVLILVLVIGINLLGDGIRDLLDPRLRSGALSRPVARTEAAPAGERARGGSEPSDAGRHLLEVRGLEVAFGGTKAVNGVDFTLDRGETLGIVGESGSGKSVTALSILGLVPTPPGRIAKGSILFDGKDLLDLPLHDLQDIRGARIAYVFQDPLTTLNPVMTVGAQIAETIRRHRGVGAREARRLALDLLRQVRLPEPERRLGSYPHQLSGGQRQRVGIAMALANTPDIIIADEPTTALDVTTQARILDLLAELERETGIAMIFITHDLGVVEEICDRVLVMHRGRIVESGPVGDIFARPQDAYTKRLLASVPRLGEPGRALEAADQGEAS
ncbi:dipeptide/oligopeptide/nickel ABC transporter permease/ATP-binding protein [Marinivivus vitaminiproducens]|uniref:dipeptide/oligopeptide/nickel ABC transporter permease/ATP-binding protein n=1 Tax=Marinivivus vitaminiproducens TaxID=3035935 RepID=UPI0027A6D281|nr:dipeptide/oligopeptide/nickel ABC transporter permease/ATP-binding protein [Geminicoccaceae bacterium SCSIO 64248]